MGSPNDGFLYVWSINQRTGAAKLHSSNKCTSFIKQIIWLGNNIVTYVLDFVPNHQVELILCSIGTRHIKIWRVEESRSLSPAKKRFNLDGTPQPVLLQPTLKTLAGRNVLLGPLVEATFTTLAAISSHKAIVCSERGDVCLLDDSEGQKLMRLANTGFAITCVAVSISAGHVKIGGKNGQVRSLNLADLLAPSTPPESPTLRKESISSNDTGHVCAMGYAADSLVTIDSKHSIEVSSQDSDTETPNVPFPAHGDAVLGVRLLSQPNDMDAAFLTWSANGTIVFWDLEGTSKKLLKVEIEQALSGEDDCINQCQIVRPFADSKSLVTGDRYGVLRIIDTITQNCTFETRAHVSDIQDIAIFETNETILVASCGRDRTIQLFRKLSDLWVLVQTLDEHSASICGLFFAERGEKLISCSTDRTIHIRQLVKKDVGGQDLIGAGKQAALQPQPIPDVFLHPE